MRLRTTTISHGGVSASSRRTSIRARSLFSAVHGMVALGLEQKLVAVPARALRQEIATTFSVMVKGLIAQSVA